MVLLRPPSSVFRTRLEVINSDVNKVQTKPSDDLNSPYMLAAHPPCLRSPVVLDFVDSCYCRSCFIRHDMHV